MKLTMTKRMAIQTRGEASPVRPVHDQLSERCTVALAPRLRSNSETSTQTTLNPS
jgi:hypothetical protein